ncbi:MAG: DUF4159 domain-containing protein [Bacteroidetes bacterium]|nr:DUF4159 domain-containing protein [Bacteroidota bacterium]
MNRVVLVGALLWIWAGSSADAQSSKLTIARIKYGGGGDWYGNRTAINNLLKFLDKESNIRVQETETYVEPSDVRLFDYPILYLAGHGNIKFSEEDIKNLRRHLSSGGFLWCDDDYGIDRFFRREMKKVFPDLDFVPIPFSHPIFRIVYSFPQGLPKIHEHDGGPPEAYGLFLDGRLICFYSKNTDLSDGLEGPAVFPEDGPEKHEQALRMATNIITYALSY